MFKALLKTMRPKQWAKNIFLFAGLIFDQKLTDIPSFFHVLAGFILFSLISGVVYIINDIADVEGDRKHPKKCSRPIASGALPIRTAWVAAGVILLIVIPLAFLLSSSFSLIVLTYFLLNLAYSKWLKHIPIIDVIILASFYVIRVAAGVVLIDVMRFSPWLYVVTTLLALFIGFGKRRAELTLLEEDAINHRRVLEGYTIPLLDQFITIVSGTTIVAYSLYTFSAPNLPSNHSMMLTIPFVLYGIFRYLYLIHLEEGGSPEDVVFADRPLQAAIILYSISVVVIFYLLNNT